MMQITLETPDHVHLLMCGDDVEVLDEETIEVTAPDWLGRGRMPVEAWMVRELIRWEDHEGLGRDRDRGTRLALSRRLN